MYLYIELLKAKDAWLRLSAQRRGEYVQQVGSSMQGVLERGAELVAVGSADPATSHHAGYDFYSVWKLSDRGTVEAFEKGIEDDGWYEYFEQVNASGEIMEFDALALRLVQL